MPSHAHTRLDTRSTRRNELTLLDEIETRFRLLAAGPRPLSVDGRQIGHGLPQRSIPLPELSSILIHPSCLYPARDAVWRLLVTRARTAEARWVVGAVGVALPGLRFKAHLLSQLSGGDVHAALVEAFLRALKTVDTSRPGAVSKLLSAAFSTARTMLRAAEPAASGEVTFAPGSTLRRSRVPAQRLGQLPAPHRTAPPGQHRQDPAGEHLDPAAGITGRRFGALARHGQPRHHLSRRDHTFQVQLTRTEEPGDPFELTSQPSQLRPATRLPLLQRPEHLTATTHRRRPPQQPLLSSRRSITSYRNERT